MGGSIGCALSLVAEIQIWPLIMVHRKGEEFVTGKTEQRLN